MLLIGGAEFDLPQYTLPPTVGIYIHQRNTGKGRGLQQHMHTTGDSNSDENFLKTRTPPTTKPQIQKTCFCNNKNIPHPFSTDTQVSPFVSSPPQNHRSFLLVSIQLYNIHAEKKKPHLPSNRRCWFLIF